MCNKEIYAFIRLTSSSLDTVIAFYYGDWYRPSMPIPPIKILCYKGEENKYN